MARDEVNDAAAFRPASSSDIEILVDFNAAMAKVRSSGSTALATYRIKQKQRFLQSNLSLNPTGDGEHRFSQTYFASRSFSCLAGLCKGCIPCSRGMLPPYRSTSNAITQHVVLMQLDSKVVAALLITFEWSDW